MKIPKLVTSIPNYMFHFAERASCYVALHSANHAHEVAFRSPVYAVYLLNLACGSSMRVAFFGVLELLFMAAIKLLLCTLSKLTHSEGKFCISDFNFASLSSGASLV